MEDEILYDKDGNVYERKGNNWYEPKWDMWRQQQAQEDVKNDLEFNPTVTNFDGKKLFQQHLPPNQDKPSSNIDAQIIGGTIGLVFSGVAWVIGKLFEKPKPKALPPEKTFFSASGVLITSKRVIVNKDNFLVGDISLASPTRWNGLKYEVLLRIKSGDRTYAIHSADLDRISKIEAAIREAIRY